MAYIGKGLDNGVRNQFIFAATQGQTAFSGADSDGKTLAISDILYTDCFQNGVKLEPTTDYTVTLTSLTLVNAASLNDVVDIVSFDIFAVPDTVPASTGGTFNGVVTAPGYSSSTAGTSNFRAGVNAGNSIESGGNYNVAVGDEAGTAITTGDENTVLGYRSGDAITTGTKNTALGAESLSADTLGSNSVAIGRAALANQNFTSATDVYNTAVGARAGVEVTTGVQNTLIGGLAGDAITTGVSNVAVGYKALTTNVDGDGLTAIGFEALENFEPSDGLRYTVAVGYQAGKACTAGGDNIFVGGQAGLAVTDGNNNVAIGKLALSTNVQGDRNVAVGHEALKVANPSGDVDTNNTAVGYNAGAAVTTGTKNTLIGGDAGSSLNSGADNVFVGYRAGTNTDAQLTGTENVIIGSLAYGSSGGGSTAANVIGFGVGGATNYTTVGNGTDDIRAANGTATWATVSDERYKKDIVDSTAGLSFINALQPRTFKYKTLGELPETFRAYEADSTEVFKNSVTNHGFIAQEIKAAIDADSSIADGFKLWDDREDGSQEVAEAALIPVLVKAIQELTARLETLEG